jgi:Domain of unknown function (DUF4055)
VSRTIDGLIGAVTRLPHNFNLPMQIEPMMQDASLDGLTLDETVKGLLAETLLQGRAGLLTDIDEATGVPYLTMYCAEAIVNWGKDYVVLQETVLEPSTEDRWKLNQVIQYRLLSLTDGRYTVTVFRKNSKAEWIAVSEVTPTRRGKPLTELPWAWVSPLGSTARITRSPMLGIVDLALSHLRLSCDHYHALFHSSLPTLYVCGVSEDKEIQIGGAAAILLQDANSKVGYCEYTGSGVGSIRSEIEKIEMRAGSLGASILLAEKERGNETAYAAGIRSSSQTAILSQTVWGVQDGLTKALKIAAWWAGSSDNAKVGVTLNDQFVPSRLDSAMVAALIQGVQAGAISVAELQATLSASGVIEEPKAAA